MKRLVFCFDGTTNKLAAVNPTNVVLMAESILPTTDEGINQSVYYDEGVGTGKWARLSGTLFGVGLLTNLREAYRFLIFNHEPGDEIFIFGFSRGAFTARSFAGFIRHVGILDVNSARQIDAALAMYEAALKKDGDDHISALKFRAAYSAKTCVSDFDEDWRCEHVEGFRKGDAARLNIKYVGVWDTVGALGWPNVLPFASWLNRRRGFHDVRLTSKVYSARHALALDECRKLFRPTIWSNINELNTDKDISPYDPQAPYQQKWFPGVHGAVGGGGPHRGLSDSALSWILAGARRAGLKINIDHSSRVHEVAPDPLSPLQNEPERPVYERGLLGRLNRFLLHADREGPQDMKDVSAFALRRWATDPDLLPEKRAYRPASLAVVREQIDHFIVQIDGYEEGDLEYKAPLFHIVQPGDDLPKIAVKYLGSAARGDEIWEMNRDLIDDPGEIHIGWKLRLPKA
jgi:uncharacterized protein (DUF2235 family)